ncbi:MAG: CRTAC1 family protein [Flavobacteriales bacterium]|nr:MAG: CRTAC1 family protein [Flavobacteriales bacterium]
MSLLVLATTAMGQGGWTMITDASNPIVAFTSNGLYKGAAWVDYDNDNDIDLFAAPNFLFRNDGGGAFIQVTSVIGTAPLQFPGGSSWADADNDGDMDCALAQYPSGLYLNNGDGSFTDATTALDSLSELASWGCAFGETNGDGYPEVLYVHATGFHPAGAAQRPCRFYRSDGTFAPEPVRGYDFTESLAPYTVPYWSDYDLDGDMDLFIASGPGGSPGYDHCYRNMRIELGEDTLIEMTTEAFASVQQDGQCYNFIDADNDGDLDLCLTNYAGAASRFYRNNSGIYSPESTPWTTGLPRLANCWGDYDNDGDLDVVITSDYASVRYYSNDGTGTFTHEAGSISTANGSTGCANGDMDNDGDLDLFVYGSNASKALFRNDTVAGNRSWYSLKLVGTASGTTALGGLVRLKATINGVPRWQIREVNAQNSFQGHNDLRAHFGLGDATSIDSLEVRWPSGLVQSFGILAANARHTIVEGDAPTTAVPEAPNTTLDEEQLFTVQMESANDFMLVTTTAECPSGTWTLHRTNGQVLTTGRLSGSFKIPLGNLSNEVLLMSAGCGERKQTTPVPLIN